MIIQLAPSNDSSTNTASVPNPHLDKEENQGCPAANTGCFLQANDMTDNDKNTIHLVEESVVADQQHHKVVKEIEDNDQDSDGDSVDIVRKTLTWARLLSDETPNMAEIYQRREQPSFNAKRSFTKFYGDSGEGNHSVQDALPGCHKYRRL
ncbi:hypothetical protein IFR05_001414 [Cadophora sp. M221]|nr:hypothetical protein IFR05_001414 [Cadophora sp. M221]